MSPAVARLKNLFPAIVALVLGVLMLGFAQSHMEIECTRASGMCEYRRSSFGSTERRPFRMIDVREVRWLGNLGKNGRDAEVQFVFSNGNDTSFGRDTEDDVRPLYDRTRDFFLPNGSAPSYKYSEPRPLWPWLAGIGGLIAAGVLGVTGWRKRVLETVPLDKPAKGGKIERTVGEQTARRKRIILIGTVAVACAAIMVVMAVVESHGKGTLALECKARCRLGSMECMPGASMETPYEPGTHTIEVWASSGSALWIPRTFEIVEGETTTVICKE